MSKGIGKTGRGILTALVDHDGPMLREMNFRELAMAIYGEDYTAGDLTSIGRAVRNLEQRGKVWTRWTAVRQRQVEVPRVDRTESELSGRWSVHMESRRVNVPGKVVYLTYEARDELAATGSPLPAQETGTVSE